MNDLIEFIKARLDDDERVARATAATSSGSWRVTARGEVRDSDGIGIIHSAHTLMTMRAEAEHIARWDPARALAEIDAKRRIITRIAQWLDVDDDYDPVQTSFRAEAEPVAQELALPYAGHPDYRKEWRP